MRPPLLSLLPCAPLLLACGGATGNTKAGHETSPPAPATSRVTLHSPTVIKVPDDAPEENSLCWSLQLGTPGDDVATAVALDGANGLFITGTSDGALEGQKHSGKRDVFLLKLTHSGELVWARLMGSSEDNVGSAVATSEAGHVYLTGWTEGALDGSAHHGSADAFLTKYSSDGIRIWTQVMGGPGTDHGTALAVGPDGSVYVAGHTEGDFALTGSGAQTAATSRTEEAIQQAEGTGPSDATLASTENPPPETKANAPEELPPHENEPRDSSAVEPESNLFFSKFSADGKRLWTRTMGGMGRDIAASLKIDAEGHILLSGWTSHSLAQQEESYDVFLTQFNSKGETQWTRTLQTQSLDTAQGLAIGRRGATYVAANLPPEEEEAAVEDETKKQNQVSVFLYDSQGEEMWKSALDLERQWSLKALAFNPAGGLLAVGTEELSPRSDIAVARFDEEGELTSQFTAGSTGSDLVQALEVDEHGHAFAVGSTNGTFRGQPREGGWDVFITSLCP